MTTQKLSPRIIFLALLFLFVGGCTLEDRLNKPAPTKTGFDLEWLKQEFANRNAASLLTTKFGEGVSYQMRPEWGKIEFARNAENRNFYYIPLLHEDNALVSGNSRKLKVVGIKPYLIAYAEDGADPQKLTFIKGEFLTNDGGKDSPLAKSVPVNTSPDFSGKAVFTGLSGESRVFQYFKPLPQKSQGRLSRETNSQGFTQRDEDIEPCEDSVIRLNFLVSSWPVIGGHSALMDIIRRYRYSIPATRPATLISTSPVTIYANPFNDEQWARIRTSLTMILSNCPEYIDPDLTGEGDTGNGQWVCEKKCHWAADCDGDPGSGTLGGVVVTINTSLIGQCMEPRSMATCSEGGQSPWYLVRSEDGQCNWVPTGTNGGIPLPPGVGPLIQIAHNLNNRCLIEMFSKFNSAQWTNPVSAMVRDVFKRTQGLNLQFFEITTLPDSIDAIESESHSGNIINISIDLNLNKLPSASQEYIVATMLHEALHGIFSTRGMLGELDHDTMADYYISKMAAALEEIFPNLANDHELAVALAWGGLQKTVAWQRLRASNPTLANAILQTNIDHRKGLAGSICTP